MPVPLYDAHIHLADSSLLAYQEDIWQKYDEIGLAKATVVGTCPRDWAAVLELGQSNARVIPAVGLHPWEVNVAQDDWQQQFIDALDQGAQAIGEIGLDRWIEGHDIEGQQAAFRFQLGIATERNLPCSIHCLRAIGPMMDTLRSAELPKRGIHIHAYNGSVELISDLVELGSYFSFNAGQLRPEKPKVPERIKAIPAERLLIETDAPDFLPAMHLREFELPNSKLCHPANLRRSYQAIAAVLGTDHASLAEQVQANFKRYFDE